MDFVDSGVSRNPVMQRLYQSIATVSSAFTHVNVLGIANCRHREWQAAIANGNLQQQRTGPVTRTRRKIRIAYSPEESLAVLLVDSLLASTP